MGPDFEMEADRGFSVPLQKWVNSPSLAMFWASIGCVCSFFCPYFLGLENWLAIGDLSPLRMSMMLLSFTTMAGAYRTGYVLRHRGIMREQPARFGMIMVGAISMISMVVFGATFMEWGTWPNVVGLELLAIAVFGLLEMARPVVEIYLHTYLFCLPIIAGGRRHGWDFVYFGWPMLTVPVGLFFLLWRVFVMHVAGQVLARA